MRKSILAVLALLAIASPASALGQNVVYALQKLDPATRLEQLCDIEMMNRIKHDSDRYDPDRVVAYALKDPTVVGNELDTDGAAFRSKGQWYRLQFKCQAAPDHLAVLSLRYKIGDVIPRKEWKKYNLWP